MKILHVLSSNRFSGAENVACQIINLFKNDINFEMAYCSPQGPIEDVLNKKDIKYFSISSLSVSNIKQILSKYKPDVIHSHDMKASLICSLASKKIPIISHIHNNAYDSRKISIKSLAFLYASRKINHIFWVSNSALNDYKFKNKIFNKSSVLENIIDVEELYKKINLDENEYEYDVIYLGRLSYPKNPHRLLEVIKELQSKLPKVKVAIIGTGELEEEIKNYCSQLGLNNNIDFLGYLTNPIKILWQSKVMIMTSRWEGIPMCALEAIALDVKIVSTKTDGLCDIVINDNIGYLSDDDNVLVEKLLEYIQNHIDKDKTIIERNKINENKNLLIEYKKSIMAKYKEC